MPTAWVFANGGTCCQPQKLVPTDIVEGLPEQSGQAGLWSMYSMVLSKLGADELIDNHLSSETSHVA